MSRRTTDTPRDWRARHIDGGWMVDRWTPRGWEELPEIHATKHAAVESTRPPSPFCQRHWSWLCGSECRPAPVAESFGVPGEPGKGNE